MLCGHEATRELRQSNAPSYIFRVMHALILSLCPLSLSF